MWAEWVAFRSLYVYNADPRCLHETSAFPSCVPAFLSVMQRRLPNQFLEEENWIVSLERNVIEANSKFSTYVEACGLCKEVQYELFLRTCGCLPSDLEFIATSMWIKGNRRAEKGGSCEQISFVFRGRSCRISFDLRWWGAWPPRHSDAWRGRWLAHRRRSILNSTQGLVAPPDLPYPVLPAANQHQGIKITILARSNQTEHSLIPNQTKLSSLHFSCYITRVWIWTQVNYLYIIF